MSNPIDTGNPLFLFCILGSLYALFFIAGFITGKTKAVRIQALARAGSYLVDPLSKLIHKKLRTYKYACLAGKRWARLFILIFLNNLVIVALIQHVLYGVIFFVPAVLVCWYGFGHGVVFTRKSARSGFVIIIFEYSGYISASVIGLQLGLEVISRLFFSRTFTSGFSWQPAIFTLIYLFWGAFLETAVLSRGNFENLEAYLSEEKRQEYFNRIDGSDKDN